MIIDLAIEHDPKRLIFIADRLMSGSQVDDAEPAHADADWTLGVNTIVVRSTMCHHVAHASHHARLNTGVISKFHHSGDSAHRLNLPQSVFCKQTAYNSVSDMSDVGLENELTAVSS